MSFDREIKIVHINLPAFLGLFQANIKSEDLSLFETAN